MRIGILTLPLHTNYGGILQAYALQTVLERMGHEVVVFDLPKSGFMPPMWKMPLCYAKRILKKVTGQGGYIFVEQHLAMVHRYIAQYTQPFIDEHIHRREVRHLNRLKDTDYDALVVGSDQVWRPFYFVRMWGKIPMEEAFLSFAKGWNVKRMAYAASFGTDEWEYTDAQTQHCGELLHSFDAVSVREANAVHLCEEHFGLKAQHVLDPTMLLSKEDYCNLFLKKNTPKSKGGLLCYVLDESKELKALINDLAEEKHLVPFSVNNPFEYDETKPLEQRVKGSVESWLRGFYDAEFVITDSFHACVFSIIFKKQFVVVGNKERGMSRFESLLRMFGLESRMVSSDVDIKGLAPIDYALVYEKYEKLKGESLEFISKTLR